MFPDDDLDFTLLGDDPDNDAPDFYVEPAAADAALTSRQDGDLSIECAQIAIDLLLRGEPATPVGVWQILHDARATLDRLGLTEVSLRQVADALAAQRESIRLLGAA